jgi:hypothetical protein
MMVKYFSVDRCTYKNSLSIHRPHAKKDRQVTLLAELPPL